ncbi:hypothetical protein CRP143_gp14 [Roseobacter phage CRP-143]|nr:hypothetical protein CRP143_gp14 [Roseobacter phage CRP-143]
MARYEFDTPMDLVDEMVKLWSPRELADYLYHNYEGYVKEVQWEVETFQLDEAYKDFDSFEEYSGQLELFPQ